MIMKELHKVGLLIFLLTKLLLFTMGLIEVLMLHHLK